MGLFSKKGDESTVDELLKKSEEVERQAQEARREELEKKESVLPKVNITGDKNDPHSLAYLNANGVDVVSGIEILGNEESYEKMLKDFSSTVKNKYNKLIDSKASRNLKDYAEVSNDIKTTANYLGLNKLYELSKDHAFKAENDDYNYIVENFKEYDDELTKIIGTIAARYQ